VRLRKSQRILRDAVVPGLIVRILPGGARSFYYLYRPLGAVAPPTRAFSANAVMNDVCFPKCAQKCARLRFLGSTTTLADTPVRSGRGIMLRLVRRRPHAPMAAAQRTPRRQVRPLSDVRDALDSRPSRSTRRSMPPARVSMSAIRASTRSAAPSLLGSIERAPQAQSRLVR